jgi:hypothetical protein
MRSVFNPFQFVVIAIAGWMNQHQQHVVEYLLEENRVTSGADRQLPNAIQR